MTIYTTNSNCPITQNVLLDTDHYDQFGYFSIPNCCDIAHIKSVRVKNLIPLLGHTDMLFFKWSQRDQADNLILDLTIALRDYNQSNGKSVFPPNNKKFYWIHTSTSCRIKSLKVSVFPDYNNYMYNYFDSRAEAQYVIDNIIRPIFIDYGISL